jgi:hypothetical protein
MSFNPDHAFDLMLCMYRTGLLDRVTAIQGQAMDEVMDEAGISMGDIMNRIDQADAGTIDSLDRMIGKMGPLLRYVSSDLLMRSIARVIDIPLVKRFLLARSKRSMLKVFAVPQGTLSCELGAGERS